MAIKTWIGRYSIVDGRVQEEGPWMGAFVRQRPDEVTDELYVIVEPALPGSEQFCGQLVEVVGRLFRQDTLSLTGAVIRSLRAAHEHLREWNQRSLREHRVASGAACLAVQGTQAYVALVGPSLAYIFQNGELRRLVPEERDPEDALGLAEDLYPDLHRAPVTPGARVLICSTRLDRLIDEATLARILAQDEPLPDLYRLTKDEPDFSLVMLACYEEPEPAPAAAPAEEAPPPPRPISAGREPRLRPAGERTARLPPLPEEGSQIPLVTRPTHREVETFASEHPPSVDVTRPVVRLRGEGSAGVFRRRTGPSGGLRLPLPLVALALLVGLAAVVAYCALPGSVEESRRDRLDAALTHARGALYLASQQTDPGEKRRWLEEASRAIADAAAIDPADDLVITTQGQIRAAVEMLDAVTDVGTLTPLVDLRTAVAGDLSSARVEIAGDVAFFLDTAGGRVIEASLVPGGPAPRVALREGDEVGGAVVARVQRIAWAPELGALLALDAGRRLYAIPPGGAARTLALRNPEEWGSADALATYDGSLYVLDAAGATVWRYVPTEGGFDSERQSVLAAPDLAAASDLVAAGDVYLIDGARVRRFNSGQELTFPLAGIDKPLSSPAGVAVDLRRGEVYIADRGNRRIVVASLDGLFLRQLTSPSFTDLRDVAVGPGGRLFALNGDALLELPAAAPAP